MAKMTLEIGERIDLVYTDEHGKRCEDGGWVWQNYPNGQFVLADRPGTNPRRYDTVAVKFI